MAGHVPRVGDARSTAVRARRVGQVALLALTLGVAVQTAVAQDLAACWRGRVAEADRYVQTRPGVVSFAIVTPSGTTLHHRGRRRYPSASLLKTTLMVSYLRTPGVRARALTREERRLLGPMIRRSDNPATNVVVGRLTRAQITRAAVATGQRDFRFELPIWGLSDTSAIDQVRLFTRLDAAVPPRHRSYARRLLGSVVGSQRWGLATTVPDGWSLIFKGGWGSGTGQITSQAGLLERGDSRMAIAVLTARNPSHGVGVATIRGVASRLLANGHCAPG